VQGSFTPSADNFIGIEFLRNINDSTTDQVNFWNPTSNIEFTKTVPLAITLDYKIVINTTLTSNVLPIAVVKTNSSNNVESITDRRPMLYRLGTAGFSNPNPFHLYDWSEGRTENFYTSFSSTSNPFAGGDKQIATMKDFFDAIMTEFKLLKGTPFWYSESAGSISRLRQDIANMAFTGKGNVIHGAFDFQGIQTGMTTSVIIKTIDTSVSGPITLTANGVDTIDTIISNHNLANPTNQVYLYSGNGLQVPSANITLESKAGQLNWTDDLFLNFIGGRLRYRILKNEASNHITLSNNQVAYVKLVRGVNIVPNIKFTQTSTIVESVGGVIWTTDLQPGDFIKDASKGDEFYYQIASVDVGGSQVTLTQPYQETSTGLPGINAQYAFGVYETNSAPSSDRHIKILDRGSVPFGEDYFWLYYRQDELLGSIAKIYARILGGQELQQGEWQQVSDNTSESVLQYIGSPSESDIDPNYAVLADNAKSGTTNYNASNGENLTARISKITSMVADKAQDKTIKLVSDHTYAYNSTNGALQEVSFSGGSGTATVVMPSSADNGSIVLSGNFSLGVNQVAYFNVTRNGGFVYAGLSTLIISNISSVPLDENVFIFAYRLNDTNVHLWNNQVLLEGSSIAPSVLRSQVQQNKTIKLVKGGIWSWDLVSNKLTNSSSAYIQVAGLSENVNQINAQSITLAADGECAYIALKRTSGSSILTVSTANISSVPQNDDTFIIARRVGDDVIVGTNSFALKDGEFLELDGALAEINRHHDQLAILPTSPIGTRVKILGSDILKLSGSKISLEQKKLLLSFEGVEIDFGTGYIYELDGVTPFLSGANNFTPFSFPTNSTDYFYYSISLLPNTVQPDNTISGQILVIPSTSSDAILENAPKAPFPSSGIKLGNVYVQGDSFEFFNVGGSGFDSGVNVIIEQSDGKVIVGGNFSDYNGVTIPKIQDYILIRLNTDGSPDLGFSTGSGAEGRIYSIIQQTDGKLIVGGSFITYNGITVNRIVRLNSDGSIDSSFNTGTGFNSSVRSIVLQSDGKLVIVGGFATYNGITVNRIVRLNSDGSIDSSFNTGTGFNSSPTYIIQQSNGQFVVGGNFSTYNGVTTNGIVRLYANGFKDITFNTGTGPNGAVNSIVEQSGGKIVVGGAFGTYNGTIVNFIVRLNPDGSIDSSFNTGTGPGSGFNTIVQSIVSQPYDKIIVGGSFVTYKGTTVNRIVRLNSNGSIDSSFNTGTGFDNTVYSIAKQSNGQFVVGGNFLNYNGTPAGCIIKLQTTNISSIDYENIIQLGVGGSGSGGIGDANSFTENLKHRLISSYYEYVTPVVFEIDEENLTESATASYSIVDGTYKFSLSGQNFISKNMFDTEFLQNDHDSRRVELHAEWLDSSTIDENASYEVSLDGITYQPISMTRQGLSQKFTGDILLNVPASTSGYVLSSMSGDIGITEKTESFSITNKIAVNKISLNIVKTGNPLGSYTISIVEDNLGTPTGNVVYSKIALCSSLSVGNNSIILSNFRNILISDKIYWVVIKGDAAYNSSYNSSTTKIAISGSVLLEGHVYDLRVKITSSAANKKLKAFGIFYDEHVGDVVTGIQALQKIVFSGDLNTTSFTLTRFLPDPDNMKVYDIKTGQVYRYPAFSISGHTVIFPAGTFLAPGETVELIFDQSQGSGFDHSDQNGNLLAANHLGSTDPTIDKSSPGRGIFLKKPNGELVEVCVDDANNIVIYSV
jgi:uncharacterized delta-60 repeat protein